MTDPQEPTSTNTSEDSATPQEGTEPEETAAPAETSAEEVPATPIHLWFVGGVALLWNAMGAMDYVMVEMKHEGYMSEFTPEQVEFVTSYPMWMVSMWALAVWGGVLGSILLLMRKPLATKVFLVSWVTMVVTTFYNYVISNGLEVFGTPAHLTFSAIIFLVALGLVFYSRAMERRGVLS